MVEFAQDISLQDLRAIIHGLKIAGFSSIEDGASDHITFRIRSLPSAETLVTLNPKLFRDVIKEVGEIMRLIEIFSSKNPEFKARFKSKKKLPPRYKVLDWRKASMNNQIVKDLVKMSSIADEKGHEVIASKLLRCASKANAQEDITTDFNEVETMMKEAGIWGGVKDLAKGIGQAVGDKAKQVGQAVGGAVQSGKEMFQIGKYKSTLQDINNKLKAVKTEVANAANGAVDVKRKQQLQEISGLIDNMYGIGSKLYTVINDDTSVTNNQTAPVKQNTETTSVTPVTPSENNAPTEPSVQVSPAPVTSENPVLKELGISGLTPVENTKDMFQAQNGEKYTIQKFKTASSQKWIRIV